MDALRKPRPLLPALLVVLGLSLMLLAGCAAKPSEKAGPRPTGFASADAKNIHDFLAAYPGVLMSGDVDAIRRLYTKDARIVPFLHGVSRPVRGREFSRRLPGVVAAEREAGLRVAFVEPMQITVTGTRASARLVARLAWTEGGQPQAATMSCYFGLMRDEYYRWKIREAHAEPVREGFTLPPAQPAPPPGRPGPADTAASPQPPHPRVEQGPQPLF